MSAHVYVDIPLTSPEFYINPGGEGTAPFASVRLAPSGLNRITATSPETLLSLAKLFISAADALETAQKVAANGSRS